MGECIWGHAYKCMCLGVVHTGLRMVHVEVYVEVHVHSTQFIVGRWGEGSYIHMEEYTHVRVSARKAFVL